VSEGLRWARGVLHEVVLLLGLLLLTAGVTVSGLLLHRPAWFVGVFGGLLLLVILFEGAYRIWDEADRRAETAEASTGGGSSLGGWLDLRADELRGLRQRLDDVLATVPFQPEKARSIESHFREINNEVDRKLHTSAPEWVDYFNENPTRFPMGLTFIQPEQFRDHVAAAIDATISQITHVRATLK